MIGPRAFRLPNKDYPEALSWSVNTERVLELAKKMGVPAEKFRLDFFGGTMFWVRPEALAPLRRLKLSEAFPEERGLLDGGPEHARRAPVRRGCYSCGLQACRLRRVWSGAASGGAGAAQAGLG